MKNQIKPIISALLLSLTFIANARTLPANPSIKPYALSIYKIKDVSAINVFINKIAGTKMKLVLKDASGKIVHEEYINKKDTKVRTQFNLSQLEKGAFTIELINDKSIEVKSIVI